jgi:hypothetical protein
MRTCYICHQGRPDAEYYDGNPSRCKVCDSFYNRHQRKLYFIKKEAQKRGLEFSISDDEAWALCSGSCYYCGGFDDLNGIDRIDSTKGYIGGNCVSCCKLCNSAKGDLSTDDFIEHILNIASYYSR